MIGNEFTVDWRKYIGMDWDDAADTTISPATAAELGRAITKVPPDVKLHGRVQRIIDERSRMAAGTADMDWGFAETMAYASLIRDGVDCRLVGQDSGAMRRDMHERYVTMMTLNLQDAQAKGQLVDWVDAAALAHQLFSDYCQSMLTWALGELDDDGLRASTVFGMCLLLLGVARGAAKKQLEQQLKSMDPPRRVSVQSTSIGV